MNKGVDVEKNQVEPSAFIIRIRVGNLPYFITFISEEVATPFIIFLSSFNKGKSLFVEAA
jgi:hypothetical protein